MGFSYFYEQEADMFSFYRIPKLLFTDERFKALSMDAKVLYGLMLDRMSLSSKNQWYDREKKVFIYFSLEDVMELLNCKKNKAIDTMKELDAEKGVGLIEKVRQGQGKPTMIYVKNFMEKSEQKLEKQTSGENQGITEVGKTNLLKLENPTSGSPFFGSLEVGKTNPNNLKYNSTEFNETESNRIVSGMESGMRPDGDKMTINDEMSAYAELIRENISLDVLLQGNPLDRELLVGIYELILETVLYKGERIVIASNVYPVELIKSKFLKLNDTHILYVLDCMKGNTTKVRNIKKYLLAALFNAPTTISGYYQSAVNHDMPEFATRKAQ